MKRLVAVVAAAVALAAASSAAAAPRQKVAVLDVRAVQGVQPGTATILTAIIAGDTAAAGYDVLSQADIGALIGFERQKKMLGCGDDSSCLAEIGGALGAEFVLSTQVGQIGSRFHLSLQLLDAKKGFVVSRVSTFSETTEDALAATAQRAVAQALAAARERSPAKAPAVAVASPARTATATAIATATATSTVNPTATAAPSESDGEGFLSRHPLYAELRLGFGWNSAAMPTSSGTVGFDGPGFGVRAGLGLSRAWALELGVALRPVRHTESTYTYGSAALPTASYDVVNDVRALALGLGVVSSPRALRWVSIALDAGVENVTVTHDRANPSFTAGPSAPVSERVSLWAPRLGAELRADVPLGRRFALGLRAGIDLARLRARQTALNPFAPSPPAGTTAPQIEIVEDGWLVTYPIDVGVRYTF